MDRTAKLIRDAGPKPGPLSSRAEADLARILATPVPEVAPTVGPKRPTHRWLLAIAASLVIAVTVAGTGVLNPAPAVAATPPLPTITAASQDAATALLLLQAKAAAQPDRSTNNQIATQWWALGSDVDATGKITSSTVDPVRRVATLGTHGITGYTDYAAQPFDTAGRPVHDSTAPIPGTQLDTVTVDADQQFFTASPPIKAAAFGDYFTDHLPLRSPSSAVNAFTSVGVLLAERILTPQQHAAFLGYLATLGDVQLLGTSADRLGRDVLVFAAPIEDENQTLLMLSGDTGMITATEVIYRGTARTDIPTPAVIEYVAWETP